MSRKKRKNGGRHSNDSTVLKQRGKKKKVEAEVTLCMDALKRRRDVGNEDLTPTKKKKKKKDRDLESAAMGRSPLGDSIIASSAKKKQKNKDPLPLPCKFKSSESLISEQDPRFKAICEQSYPGFHVESIRKSNIHKRVGQALQKLTENGYFHYDIVAYGNKVNSTRVQRVLVGAPGMTYLYQKLRLFALPWTDKSICGGALIPINELNEMLKEKSKSKLKEKRALGGHVAQSAGVGDYSFNLTLINAALVNHRSQRETIPVQNILDFKDDSRFNNHGEKLAVNWHKDSTLEPFSTIAVHHHTPDHLNSDWGIAMCCERENIAPPVVKHLQDGDAYFMLGNFNHHHLHAVCAGTTARYASTHRVAVTKKATFIWIESECKRVKAGKGENPDAERARVLGELTTVLEFDWLRQFYVQGSVHAEQHKSWWTPRIKELETIWESLEAEMNDIVTLLLCQEPCQANARFFKIVIYILKDKLEQRKDWSRRIQDSQYRRLPPPFRPIDLPKPCWTQVQLEGIIQRLEKKTL